MTKVECNSVVLLATGGTIASTARNSISTSEYRITEDAESLIESIFGSGEQAHVRFEQLWNVESYTIDHAMLLELAKRVNSLLKDSTTEGVVITHGTDTLEETAYFLDLVIQSSKPVVLVGAMRPASALSADGPLNLFNAVLLAQHPDARYRGTMVVVNDCVHSAHFVTKGHTIALDAFTSGEHGWIGRVHSGNVYLYQPASLTVNLGVHFNILEAESLPMVDIIYDYQGAGSHFYRAAIANGAKGIIVAGCGNGNISSQAWKGVSYAIRAGVPCVRSSRTGSGAVYARGGDLQKGLISANLLNPQKARILLALALYRNASLEDIQSFFDQFV